MSNWNDLPHWRRMIHLMQGLRGNWSNRRDSDMLRILYEEIELAKDENIADKNWIAAVKQNADRFDGEFNDGRIFRDGQRYIDEDIATEIGISKSPGDPEGLASALQKIHAYAAPMNHANHATAHIFIGNPFVAQAGNFVNKLFSTHPPVEDRVNALLT